MSAAPARQIKIKLGHNFQRFPRFDISVSSTLFSIIAETMLYLVSSRVIIVVGIFSNGYTLYKFYLSTTIVCLIARREGGGGGGHTQNTWMINIVSVQRELATGKRKTGKLYIILTTVGRNLCSDTVLIFYAFVETRNVIKSITGNPRTINVER